MSALRNWCDFVPGVMKWRDTLNLDVHGCQAISVRNTKMALKTSNLPNYKPRLKPQNGLNVATDV